MVGEGNDASTYSEDEAGVDFTVGLRVALFVFVQVIEAHRNL